MPMMLISVVIPAYNEEQYLGRCLAALARQTYPTDRFEVILVDNGSTDATAEIARRYGVRVIAEPRRGWPPLARLASRRRGGRSSHLLTKPPFGGIIFSELSEDYEVFSIFGSDGEVIPQATRFSEQSARPLP